MFRRQQTDGWIRIFARFFEVFMFTDEIEIMGLRVQNTATALSLHFGLYQSSAQEPRKPTRLLGFS